MTLAVVTQAKPPKPLTKPQRRALSAIAANSTSHAYGQARRMAYKLVGLGLVKVLTEKDAGGHSWWAGWLLTERGFAELPPKEQHAIWHGRKAT